MTETRIDTGGGPGFENFRGTYIAGDQIILIGGFSTQDLELVLGQLSQILASHQVVQQADLLQKQVSITAPDAPRLLLSEEAARALLPAAARLEDERAYLSALQVDPRYRRWADQFVPLAGQLTELVLQDDLPPEFSLLVVEGSENQPRLRRVDLPNISQAFEQHASLALLGEPGSGKTTTLRRLALQAAQRIFVADTGFLPLEISLADYHGFQPPFTLVQSQARQLLGEKFDLAAALRQGRLLLLFDSLNEMPYRDEDEYRLKVQALRQFTDAWPGNRVVFTCRTRDYSEKLGLTEVEIKRLTDERVQLFLEKYLPVALAVPTWERLRSSDLLELLRNPYYLLMFTTLVQEGNQWPANRAQLFEGFVRTLLGREARKQAHWPGAAVLVQALSALAETMQPSGRGTRLPREQVLAAFPAQAYDEQERLVALDAREVYRLGLAATLLDVDKPQAGEQARFFHHQLQEYFAARALLRRFAAGEDLRARWRQPVSKHEMPPHAPFGQNEALPPPPTTGWEEPTILAAGLPGAGEAFLQAVLQANPVLAAECLAEPGMPPMPALQRAGQQALLERMADRQVHLRARLAAGDALGKLGDPRFIEVTLEGVRVILSPLAHVLAGSFRMGSGGWETWWGGLASRLNLRDELPAHSHTLPAFWLGQFPVTNAEYRCFWEAGGYAEARYWETPQARAWRAGEAVEVGPENEILRTWRALQSNPQQVLQDLRRRGVLPQQIEAFERLAEMEESQVRQLAMQYYEARDRSQPYFWDDGRFNAPNQPVVGINWYEAGAYCAWLGEKLRSAGGDLSVAGPEWRAVFEAAARRRLRVRLPGEVEWEYAARGPQGRRYPWGRRFDPDRANTIETRLLRPAPVGIYPAGAAWCGAQELSGSVWEWTSSQYRPYPYQAGDGREDAQASGYRVVRGGSWYFSRWFARCAYRYRFVPTSVLNDLGFRMVLSLAGSDA